MLAMYGKARVGNGVVALAGSLGIEIRVVDDADADFDAAAYDAVIPTPGISPDIAPANRAFSAGNVLSELDFAHKYVPKGFTIIAITGTDGKSTTAWMLFELLRHEYGDERVFLSGNFEVPFSETVRDIRGKGLTEGFIVLEVSSFMAYSIGQTHFLDSLPEGEREGGFAADHTVFTNLQTDHLNWHGSFAKYFEAKKNLVDHTRNTSFVEEGVVAKEAAFDLDSKMENVRVFGQSATLADRVEGDAIVIANESRYRLSETRFKGVHNALNILASTLVLDELGTKPESVRICLAEIRGLPHRLELVKTANGISYVDDSKSTSAQSLRAALGSFDAKSVVLIAGGSDKGDEFDSLADLFGEKVKFVACIGATREKFKTLARASDVPNAFAESMPEAVALAVRNAEAGDTVLLSPGCASFGLFRDYLDRASQFKAAVYEITQ